MASITLGGNAISTVGELPQKGDKAPAFALTGADLKPVTSDDLMPPAKKKPLSTASSAKRYVVLGSSSVPKISPDAAETNIESGAVSLSV